MSSFDEMILTVYLGTCRYPLYKNVTIIRDCDQCISHLIDTSQKLFNTRVDTCTNYKPIFMLTAGGNEYFSLTVRNKGIFYAQEIYL